MHIDIEHLIRQAVNLGASDLYLLIGAPPTLRIAGYLTKLDYPPLLPEDTEKAVEFFAGRNSHSEAGALTHVSSRNEDDLSWDVAYEVPGACRLRVHVSREMGNYALTIRLIPLEVPRPEDLNLPAILVDLCKRPGLLLITGPTGSGKSTTLASLMRYLLETKSVRLVSIEDPVEFKLDHFNGLVSQKEVGVDCISFHHGLIDALRESPDVIILGELRDPEAADAALLASETGHLVISTMHTPSAIRAIDRFIDLFPAGRQEFARSSLSRALNGVFAQKLLPSKDRKRRVLAYEILVATPPVRNLIRKNEYHQIITTMEAGRRFGMVTMANSIEELVRKGLVSREDVWDEVGSLE
ncbi:MAG: PilT/PilU family type 4a pilus ATPase [Candidatus Fermentithermobacillus carboniphilus]|uniref:PilT/PilU family type 4a pilus ATPase n=1 Tax=Candidatus Fermentithermobacillus carboniphilus TaxID=3085328 RepID=A0AAT9LBX8_9FIRM|nr:MAG: PilT/PilU family type 4a pilus ATPase [Candidatus Fermentithermobacillus carboniphilus]